MRIKHNKKRNTAFLYECLIRELTMTVIKKNPARKKKVLKIIKEHFVEDNPLKEELSYFNMLTNEFSLDAPTAERLLWEVKTEYSLKINKSQIFKEQSSLIKKINTSLGKEVYNNFVPSYKQLATVHAILNLELAPKDKVLLEGNTIKGMMAPLSNKGESEKEPIDNLVYRSFVKKFNEMYGDSLLEEQKDLVSRYIVSFQDNDVGLKIYLSEEVSRLQHTLIGCKKENFIKEDSEMLSKVDNVIEILDTFKDKTIDTGLVEDVLKIQQLAHEISAP